MIERLQNKPETLPRCLSWDTLPHNNSAFDSLAAVKFLVQMSEHKAKQSRRADGYEGRDTIDGHSNDCKHLLVNAPFPVLIANMEADGAYYTAAQQIWGTYSLHRSMSCSRLH